MTYRSLLVFLDQDPQCVARTQVAFQLAKVLDCHLLGVAPTGLVDLPAVPEAEPSFGEFAAKARVALRDQAELAAKRFRDACHTAGVKSFEAIIDESTKASALVRHANCSDLTVLTQANPTAPDHRLAQHLVEQVVFHSARPTLILPYARRFDAVGTNVMVAWDDSREASRALSDALSLLRLAKQVQIVSWSEANANCNMTLRPRLDALSRWLVRHGVTADLRVERTGIDIVDAMLSHAADLNIDLIVMGAYGHVRWIERLLGSATRGVLERTTVPVLMSH